MKYAIVFSSRTGNTETLARAVRDALPPEDCLYFGPPDPAALAAKRLYVGFWTDRGTCDRATAEFLKTVTGGQVFLFGTAGFGGEAAYFDRILDNAEKELSGGAVVGRYLCQGRMPAAVRERYVKLLAASEHDPNLEQMIENFDAALSHPDESDLEGLRRAVCAAI